MLEGSAVLATWQETGGNLQALNFTLLQYQKLWRKAFLKLWEKCSREFGSQTARELGARIVRNAKQAAFVAETKAKPGDWTYDPWDDSIKEAASTYIGTKITNICNVTRAQLQAVLAEGLEKTSSPDKIAAELRKAYAGMSARRSYTIARTEVMSASNFASHRAATHLGMATTKMWISSRDYRVRDSHRNLDGQKVGINEKFSNELHYPCEPGGAAREVINCFVGSTRPLPAGEVWHAIRAEWDGEAITIQTAQGKSLTGTGNHPIMTRRGWIPLQEIQQGDELLVHGGRYWNRLGADANVLDVDRLPPTFLEILDSLAMNPPDMRATANFYGDVPLGDSEVYVVNPQRELRHHREPVFLEPAADGRFVLPNHSRRPLHAQGTLDPPEQRLGIHLSQRSLFEVVELLCCLGFGVTSDPVTHVSRAPYRGSVYTLETSAGVYFADGIVVSNCRCVTKYGFDAPVLPPPEVIEEPPAVEAALVEPLPDDDSLAGRVRKALGGKKGAGNVSLDEMLSAGKAIRESIESEFDFDKQYRRNWELKENLDRAKTKLANWQKKYKEPAANTPEWEEWRKKYDKVRAIYHKAQEEHYNEWQDLSWGWRATVIRKLKEAGGTLGATEQFKVLAGTLQGSTNQLSRMTKTWIEQQAELLPRDIANELAVDTGRLPFHVAGDRFTRAFYRPYLNPERDTLAMVLDGEERTTIHEMGHWIEDAHPEILAKSTEFLLKRVAGEKVERLSTLTGNAAYGFEGTRKDKFFNPYVGKVYGSETVPDATEILSMGLENVFYRTKDDRMGSGIWGRDPEHADYVLGLLASYF